MPEIPPSLAEFADARAARPRDRDPHEHDARRGRPTTTARAVSDGEVVPTRTVVWTAGVKPHPVVARARPAARRAAGGSVTDRTMRVRGLRQRLGDRRRRRGARPARKLDQPSPPTAQHAIRQGRRVARNVAAAIGTGARRGRSRYRTLGVFVDMGRGEAVAEHARHQVARRAGLVAGAHLPPGDDAGRQAQAAPADRLERRPALRPRRAPSSAGSGHPPRLGEESAGGTGVPASDATRDPPPEAEALHAPVLPQRGDRHALAGGVDHEAVAQRDADVGDVRPGHALPDPRAAEEQQVARAGSRPCAGAASAGSRRPSPRRCGRGCARPPADRPSLKTRHTRPEQS